MGKKTSRGDGYLEKCCVNPDGCMSWGALEKTRTEFGKQSEFVDFFIFIAIFTCIMEITQMLETSKQGMV